MTMSFIFSLCREYRPQFDRYVVDETAKQYGHEVLRLPPYHCVLNPIELLWGCQKAMIRNEKTTRTVKEALQSCRKWFAEIPKDDLRAYFDHVQREEERFWKIDGLTDFTVPPLIIPLFDDDSDDSEEDYEYHDSSSDDDFEEEF